VIMDAVAFFDLYEQYIQFVFRGKKNG